MQQRTAGLRVAMAAALLAAMACLAGFAATSAAAVASHKPDSGRGSAPNFGANVIVLDPSMSPAAIQSALDGIST